VTSAVADAAPVVGSVTPRLFTPALPEHVGPDGWVTREWSWGYDCADFLESCMGWRLLDWQKWLYVHALEKGPDRRGLRFNTICVLVSRQNGKSRWLTGLGLWRLFTDPRGRSSPDCPGAKTVLLACQNLKYAEAMLAEVAADLGAAAPAVRREFVRHWLTNGGHQIALTNDRSWQAVAANRRAARGLSIDLVLLDELREHQSWEAWNAIVPTTTARPHAQVVCCSNAGDSKSEVLRTLRDGAKARIAAQSTRDTETALFEWSVPVDADPRDESLWGLANPAMGSGLFRLQDLRGYLEAQQFRNMAGFQTEHLCTWVDALEPGIVPAEHWGDTLDETSRRAKGAEVFVGVDVSFDRGRSYVAIAAVRPDGNLHVEVVAGAVGTEWLVDWLVARKDKFAGIGVQKTGAPVSGLIPEMEAAGLTVTALSAGVELQTACGLLYDGICEHTIFHRPAPILDRAAASGVGRRTGDAWVFDRRNSPVDVAPLVAVANAVWMANYTPDVKDPQCHAWPDEKVLSQWDRGSDQLERAWTTMV